MNIYLEKVDNNKKDILYRLLEYSLFEESLNDGNDMNEDATFSYDDFDSYFENSNKIAFFIKEETNKLLGFVMISNNIENCINEFMIIPKYRRKKIGKKVAFECFNMYKGIWKVSPSYGSDLAYNFWDNVIKEYTNNNYEYKDETFIFNMR